MEIGNLLKETALFHDLKKDEIDLISRSTRVEKYPAGNTIIREGRVGTAFYIIITGKVEVLKSGDGSDPAVLANFGPGDFFGEIASVKHLPRSASVRAVEDTECLVIWRADFDGFITRFPEAAARIESAAQARLAGQQDIKGQPPSAAAH
jgi:CRP-like cAMP-binding protein